MKVTVLMKKDALVKIGQAQQDALSMTASEILNRTINANVIPFDTGTLQNESTFVYEKQLKTGVVSIVSDTPYAQRLYMHPEYNFNQSKNPNARGEWWEPYLRGEFKKVPQELFVKFLQLTGKRYIK